MEVAAMPEPFDEERKSVENGAANLLEGQAPAQPAGGAPCAPVHEPDALLLFRKPKGVPDSWVRSYWVESTAPRNVEGDPPGKDALCEPMEKHTEPIESGKAVEEIAQYLKAKQAQGHEAEIVITVHGFNNSRRDAWERHYDSYLYVNYDPAIRQRKGLVCIGYRWPSEKAVVDPAPGTLQALPPAVLWLLGIAALLMVSSSAALWFPPVLNSPVLHAVGNFFSLLLAVVSLVGAKLVWKSTRSWPWRIGSAVLVGLLAAVAGVCLWWGEVNWLRKELWAVFYLLGLAFLLLPITAVLLRLAVYFRDVYRATHYAVPDLVELVRVLDEVLASHAGGSSASQRVRLSFIGHSMGAFVVTQLVRILSDVFANSKRRQAQAETQTSSSSSSSSSGAARAAVSPQAAAPTVTPVSPLSVAASAELETPPGVSSLDKEAASGTSSSLSRSDGPSLRLNNVRKEQLADNHIGTSLCLERLVLISPDIPAEALMTRRANFLAPSLRRFREAYLLSNEGDVVLRLVSTLANSFSFPTSNHCFGYRLGNLEIVPPDSCAPGGDKQSTDKKYGIIDLAQDRGAKQKGQGAVTNGQIKKFLCQLRIGAKTLWELSQNIQSTTQNDVADNGAGVAGAVAQKASPLALQFTYIDCTDYYDVPLPLVLHGGKVVCRPGFGPGNEQPRALLTRSLGKSRLGTWEHLRLLLRYFQGKVDVHSGYFAGEYSKQLIYQLACLGYEGMLKSHPGDDRDAQLRSFDESCAEKRLQVLLSRRV
jgi:hypothetical protein